MPVASPVVMLLEDEISISAILSSVVMDMGFEVGGPFRSNKHALLFVEQCRPTAALLDFNVADGNCAPTAIWLRAAAVPFAVLSAFPKKLARGDELQSVEWLAKPFRIDAIEAMVISLIAAAEHPAQCPTCKNC
jgi:DNA-binding response OmpR family regulator